MVGMGCWGFSVLVAALAAGACAEQASSARQGEQPTSSKPESSCAAELEQAVESSKHLVRSEAHAEAATFARSTLEHCAKPPNDGSEAAVELWLVKAEAELAAKRYDDTRSSALTAQALLEREGRASSKAMARALVTMAHADIPSQRFDSAGRALERAVAISREIRDPMAEAAALWPLASVYVRTKRANEAIPLLLRVRELVRAGTPEANGLLFSSELVLWRAYQYAGKRDVLEDPLVRIAALVDQPGVKRSTHLVDALLALASIREASGREDEAVAMRERALRLVNETPALAGHRTVVAGALFAAHLARGDKDAALRVVQGTNPFARIYFPQTDRFESADFASSLELGPVPAAPAPKTQAPPGAASTGDGNISNAAHVVAAMREDFRRCYQRGLDLDGNLTGFVRLAIKVNAQGKVDRVKGLVVGLTGDVADCVLRRAGKAEFEPPSGGAAVVNVPVNLVKG